MARDQKTEALASLWLFRGLSKKDLTALARASELVALGAGQILCKEGEPGHEAYVIVTGNALVQRKGKKVATLGPGDYVGEMSLLDRGPRSATVSAQTDLGLVVLGQREFSGLIDQVPGLGHKLLTALAARLREADTKLYG